MPPNGCQWKVDKNSNHTGKCEDMNEKGNNNNSNNNDYKLGYALHF